MLAAVRPICEDEILRLLVDNVSAMLAYWDSSQRCRFANRAYQRWFGVNPESLIGTHISELLGPLYALNLPYIEGALRGEPQEFEREIPDPAGGSSRHALAHYVPDIVDGVVRGFFVLVSDISAIKRAEQSLRESEERFRLTIDEAPIGMALVAPDGRFMRVNRALCELVGYTAAELANLTFQAITHPDDLHTDLVLAGRLERGEIPRYSLAKRYIRKDGTAVHVMLNGSALRRPDGMPIFYIAQIEDITEQKRIAREQKFLADVGPILAESLNYEQTLNRVAELAVRDLADICVVDVLDEQRDARRLVVSSRDPGKGWVCELLRNIPLDRRRPHLVRTTLDTKQSVLIRTVSEEIVASFAQNEEHARALAAADIRSLVTVPLVAHGRLVGAMALVSSTPSRLYGPADVRLFEELGQRAGLAIESARLYRAAQRATQARDDLLGVVAHDLRNPLGVIVMQAAVLRTRAAGGEEPFADKAAEMVERAALQMSRLIEDLLDTTRIAAGEMHFAPASVDTEELVTSCVEASRLAAVTAAIELRLDLEGALPAVWVDRGRIVQVLDNLLGNALKFTAPGGSITVGASRRGETVLFWVRDTGRGIPAEDLPRVFDKYWQAVKTERRGSGLGLPIVKHIIDAHRGRIWVESTVAEGSTFYFTLPTASAASRAHLSADELGGLSDINARPSDLP
jgi:PAS domain S-box-containing protein